jgi:hypothetical protein
MKNKWEETNLQIYGCRNSFQNENIKEKIRQFYRDNYDGAEWNTQVKEIRDKNGWIPDEELEGFDLYKRLCRKYTNRNKKELLKNWNGLDYYDNENIRDNFNLHYLDPNYSTIDHKISVKYGYLNNIDEKIIADVSNLCITKRKINSSKRAKNENDFVLQK